MTAITRDTVAVAFGVDRDRPDGAAAIRHCSLRATEVGWMLLASDGEIIFQGQGRSSRRECLNFARTIGVLAVTY